MARRSPTRNPSSGPTSSRVSQTTSGGRGRGRRAWRPVHEPRRIEPSRSSSVAGSRSSNRTRCSMSWSTVERTAGGSAPRSSGSARPGPPGRPPEGRAPRWPPPAGPPSAQRPSRPSDTSGCSASRAPSIRRYSPIPTVWSTPITTLHQVADIDSCFRRRALTVLGWPGSRRRQRLRVRTRSAKSRTPATANTRLAAGGPGRAQLDESRLGQFLEHRRSEHTDLGTLVAAPSLAARPRGDLDLVQEPRARRRRELLPAGIPLRQIRSEKLRARGRPRRP